MARPSSAMFAFLLCASCAHAVQVDGRRAPAAVDDRRDRRDDVRDDLLGGAELDTGQARTLLPGPTAAQVESLLRRTRPATVPQSAPLELPLDWKTLPQSAPLWRATWSGHDVATAGDVVLGAPYGFLVGAEPGSGRELWRLPLARPARAYAVASCDGEVVVSIQEDRVVGLAARDGRQLWQRPLTPRGDYGFVPPGLAMATGCAIALQVVHGSPADAPTVREGEPGDLLLLDGRRGATIGRISCGDACSVTDPTDERLLLHRDADSVVVSVSDGRVLATLPGATEWLVAPSPTVPELAVTLSVDPRDQGRTLRALTVRGAVERWSRPLQDGELPISRLADAVLLVRPDAVERVDLRTGRAVWSRPLGPDLGPRVARHHTWALTADRLCLAARGDPAFVLVLATATGAPLALRLAATDPVSIAIAGDVVVAEGYEETVASALAEEAPPLREIFSLESDIDRSVRVLALPESLDAAQPVPPSFYPSAPREAVEWLRRLMPLVGDSLAHRVETGTPEAAAQLASVLGAPPSSPAAERALTNAFARSYAMPPATAGAVRARATLASVLATITPEDAARVTNETIRWLRWLHAEGWLDRMRTGECTAGSNGSPSCGLALEVLAAVDASRAALERAAATSSPMQLIAREVETIGGRAPLPGGCTPTDAEQAQMAVLRGRFQMDPVRLRPVVVEGARCIAVATLAGPVPLQPAGSRQRAGALHVHPPQPDPDVPDTWIVRTSWQSAPLVGQGDVFVVKKIGDTWRVISALVEWVS